jgi:hypothetical protein
MMKMRIYGLMKTSFSFPNVEQRRLHRGVSFLRGGGGEKNSNEFYEK